MTMNPRKRNFIVLIIATMVVLGFGLYAWLNLNSRDTSLTVDVTLGSHVVDQGSSLEIYLNASQFNAAYSINGTLENGLIIVPINENGTQITGGESAMVHYSLSQSHSHVVLSWNLTEGNFGFGVGSTENWLLGAGYYKVTEGPQVSTLPPYVSNYTFNIIDPIFQIKGISYSVSNNNTNALFKVTSSLAAPDLKSANLTVSNAITNTTTHKQTYLNFSRNLSIPGNLTLTYRFSTQSTQYITTIYLRTDLGTIMGVLIYGIFP